MTWALFIGGPLDGRVHDVDHDATDLFASCADSPEDPFATKLSELVWTYRPGKYGWLDDQGHGRFIRIWSANPMAVTTDQVMTALAGLAGPTVFSADTDAMRPANPSGFVLASGKLAWTIQPRQHLMIPGATLGAFLNTTERPVEVLIDTRNGDANLTDPELVITSEGAIIPRKLTGWDG